MDVAAETYRVKTEPDDSCRHSRFRKNSSSSIIESCGCNDDKSRQKSKSKESKEKGKSKCRDKCISKDGEKYTGNAIESYRDNSKDTNTDICKEKCKYQFKDKIIGMRVTSKGRDKSMNKCKDKRKKGKKTNKDQSFCTLVQSMGTNCCCCCAVLAQCLKEVVNLVCSCQYGIPKESRICELFSEMMYQTCALGHDIHGMLKYICKILFVIMERKK